MRIIKSSTDSKRRRILAADDEFDEEFITDDNEDSIADAVDDVADNVEDMQDAIDDISEDPSSISLDNNIADHYIAECDQCKGIFISAVLQSDQDIEYVSGICPICGKESDQYLKWVIKTVDESGVPEDLDAEGVMPYAK